jgi:hypothetical protein
MASLIDRRKGERFKCKRDVLHSTDSGDFFYKGKVCNYSKRGLYFESNIDLLQGHEVSILVKKHYSDITHIFDVKIIWCKDLQDSSFEMGYGTTLLRKRRIKDKINKF